MIENNIDDLFGAEPGQPVLRGGSQRAAGSGRGSRGGGSGPGARRPRKRVLPKLILTLVIVMALVGGGIYALGRIVGKVGGGESTADFVGPGTMPVIVVIPNGSSARDIGRILANAGVVQTPGAFVNVAAADDSATSLQPGYYRLKEHMSAAAALQTLLDPKVQAQFKIVVVPGETVHAVIDALATKTGITVDAFEAVTKKPTGLGLPSYATTVEGYFYPGTYNLLPTTSPRAVLKMFVDRFNAETAALNIEGGARALGRSPQDIVTVASIIEREVANPDEAPKVSRVIYNRLADKTGKFPTLGMDSTTRYGLQEYEGPLTKAQLASNNPYNTRTVPGLPPGAISNPGQAALEAALHPAAGGWLWFVSLPRSKVTVFASTQSEWNADLARYRAEGGG
ncbi:MAG: endolytic transglycosylase MltG [Frankia sp.]